MITRNWRHGIKKQYLNRDLNTFFRVASQGSIRMARPESPGGGLETVLGDLYVNLKILNSCVYLLCYCFMARYPGFLLKIVMTKF